MTDKCSTVAEIRIARTLPCEVSPNSVNASCYQFTQLNVQCRQCPHFLLDGGELLLRQYVPRLDGILLGSSLNVLGALVNIFGIKVVLAFGTAGYARTSFNQSKHTHKLNPPDTAFAAGLYTNNRFGTQWLVLFGAACCGVTAGVFWMVRLSLRGKEHVTKSASLG